MDPPRCVFYVERKKRHCKFAPLQHSQYCGEHQPENVVSKKGKRIPCPYSSSHTVFEYDLDTHLLKCNNRPSTCSFAVKDINLLSPSDCTADHQLKPSPLVPESLLQKVSFFKKLAVDLSVGDLSSSMTREEAQMYGICSQIPLTSLGDYTVIEIGAGKARLSYYFVCNVAGVANRLPRRVYLIDRSRPRAKFDKKISSITGHAERILCDLKDIDFTLLDIPTTDVVVIAKHACGEATCFALSAVKRLMDNAPNKNIVISIATCCHQLCSYSSYCNRQYLAEHGVDQKEFSFLTKMSSWAICKPTVDTDFSNVKKTEYGTLVKQFLDIGRINFLHRLRFSASYSCYCPSTTTPENRLLFGLRINNALGSENHLVITATSNGSSERRSGRIENLSVPMKI